MEYLTNMSVEKIKNIVNNNNDLYRMVYDAIQDSESYFVDEVLSHIRKYNFIDYEISDYGRSFVSVKDKYNYCYRDFLETLKDMQSNYYCFGDTNKDFDKLINRADFLENEAYNMSDNNFVLLRTWLYNNISDLLDYLAEYLTSFYDIDNYSICDFIECNMDFFDGFYQDNGKIYKVFVKEFN